MAVKHSGLQMKDTAAVSSLHDAIGLAQQQRVSPCLPLPGTLLNVLTDLAINTEVVEAELICFPVVQELVREEFQKKLHEWETQPSQAGTH